MLAGKGRHGLHRLEDAGGRLRVHDGHGLERRVLERRAHLLRIDRPPPLAGQPCHVGAVPLADLREAIAEVAGDHAEHRVAVLDHVGHGGLEPRRPRAGHGERDAVGADVEQSVQSAADVVEQREHVGVEVAALRRGHRLEDTGQDGTRSWTEQQARSGGKEAHGEILDER